MSGTCQRDLDFANQYNLEIIPVVKPANIIEKFSINKEAFTEDGITFNSKFLNGLTVSLAKEKIIDELEK